MPKYLKTIGVPFLFAMLFALISIYVESFIDIDEFDATLLGVFFVWAFMEFALIMNDQLEHSAVGLMESKGHFLVVCVICLVAPTLWQVYPNSTPLTWSGWLLISLYTVTNLIIIAAMSFGLKKLRGVA